MEEEDIPNTQEALSLICDMEDEHGVVSEPIPDTQGALSLICDMEDEHGGVSTFFETDFNQTSPEYNCNESGGTQSIKRKSSEEINIENKKIRLGNPTYIQKGFGKPLEPEKEKIQKTHMMGIKKVHKKINTKIRQHSKENYLREITRSEKASISAMLV